MTEPLPPNIADHGYAGIGRRFVARATDLVIFAALGFVAAVALGDRNDDGMLTMPTWLPVVLTFAVAIYETVMVAWRGQTVGKMAMGVRVVRLDTGRSPPWNFAGIRAAVPPAVGTLPIIGPPLWLATYLWALVDRRRQGLHDKAAGTVVIADR